MSQHTETEDQWDGKREDKIHCCQNAATWSQVIMQDILNSRGKTLKNNSLFSIFCEYCFHDVLQCQLTANLLGGIIEIAMGVIPSICSLTKADMAISERPAVKGAKCFRVKSYRGPLSQSIIEWHNTCGGYQEKNYKNKMALI